MHQSDMDSNKKVPLIILLIVVGILLSGFAMIFKVYALEGDSDIPKLRSVPIEFAAIANQTTPSPEPITPFLPKDLPIAFSQLIPFDGIFPIYGPQFVNAEESPFEDDELVLGVAWDGEAKAYPITVLRFREMVNDELAGIPTLVTY